MHDRRTSREYVPLAEVEAAAIRVSLTPLPTVFMFAMGAMAMRDEVSGVGPLRWKRAVRSALRERDVATLLPLADPRTTGWPDVLGLGCRRPGAVSFEESLEAILSLAPDELVAELDTAWGEQAESWRAARRTPERWIRDYGEALRRVWSVVEPLWGRSRTLLDREAERVGAAVALGAAAQGLNSLHSRSALTEDEWLLPTQTMIEGARYAMAPTFLVAPLVVEDGLAMALEPDSAGTAALTQVVYPLPGAWRPLSGDAPPPASLEGLLGQQRARILLRLDRPATAGEIAEAMHATLSAASYQLAALESAGLVTRRRNGRHVVVERTRRGTRLLELYEGSR